MFEMAKSWYPDILTAKQLRGWVLAGYLTAFQFEEVVGEKYQEA